MQVAVQASSARKVRFAQELQPTEPPVVRRRVATAQLRVPPAKGCSALSATTALEALQISCRALLIRGSTALLGQIHLKGYLAQKGLFV